MNVALAISPSNLPTPVNALRVGIVGDDPLVRRIIASSLSEQPPSDRVPAAPVEVVTSVSSAGILAHDSMDDGGADVWLWDLGPALDVEAAHTTPPPNLHPIVALTSDATSAAAALKSGALGAIPRESGGPALVAALHSATHGLVTVDPDFMAEMLSAADSHSSPVPEIAYTGDLPSAGQESIASLTPRELEVLELLAEGRSNREVATALNISEHTAKFHIGGILNKFDAASRTEAVVRGLRLGVLAL